MANLADHVATLSTEGKSQFLRDFFAGNGQKDPGSYMEQRVQIETTSKSADSEGYLTLSQLGDFLGIDKDSFEDISDYFKEVKKEVEDNQDEHEIPEEKRKMDKGSVWRDRYFYSKKGEKVSEESHKTTNVVEKRVGASSSQGKEEPEPEVLVVETMKEKKSRAKKISQMLEVLMKMMQQARGLALQMKQKNALQRGALLRLEAAENFWIEWSNREISLEEFEHFCESLDLHEKDLVDDFPDLCIFTKRGLEDGEAEGADGPKKKAPKAKAKAKGQAAKRRIEDDKGQGEQKKMKQADDPGDEKKDTENSKDVDAEGQPDKEGQEGQPDKEGQEGQPDKEGQEEDHKNNEGQHDKKEENKDVDAADGGQEDNEGQHDKKEQENKDVDAADGGKDGEEVHGEKGHPEDLPEEHGAKNKIEEQKKKGTSSGGEDAGEDEVLEIEEAKKKGTSSGGEDAGDDEVVLIEEEKKKKGTSSDDEDSEEDEVDKQLLSNLG